MLERIGQKKFKLLVYHQHGLPTKYVRNCWFLCLFLSGGFLFVQPLSSLFPPMEAAQSLPG